MIPNNFKEWACSLSGCDGGDINADTWLCGIEWGEQAKKAVITRRSCREKLKMAHLHQSKIFMIGKVALLVMVHLVGVLRSFLFCNSWGKSRELL